MIVPPGPICYPDHVRPDGCEVLSVLGANVVLGVNCWERALELADLWPLLLLTPFLSAVTT